MVGAWKHNRNKWCCRFNPDKCCRQNRPRDINATLAADVCKGKLHIARFLEFVKVNSTCDKIGVDFTFAIKADMNSAVNYNSSIALAKQF